MICLTKPALATATLKHPNPSGEEERSRRGTHSAAGGEKQQSADQTDEPPPKLEKSTGPNGVSYRRAMRSAGPRPSSSSSLSPLPSRERFLASCVSFLSECRAAGWPDARHLCGDGGGASGRRWKKGETVPRWALGLGFRESSRRGRGKLTRLGLPRSGRIPSRRFHQRLSPVLPSSNVWSRFGRASEFGACLVGYEKIVIKVFHL